MYRIKARVVHGILLSMSWRGVGGGQGKCFMVIWLDLSQHVSPFTTGLLTLKVFLFFFFPLEEDGQKWLVLGISLPPGNWSSLDLGILLLPGPSGSGNTWED